MLTEKYRPQNFNDIIGLNPDIVKQIGINMPHLMLIGPPGSGKTTLSKAIKAYLNWETLHLNGSDNRSIDDVRDTVKQFMMTRSNTGQPKLIRYEEFDYVSKDGQAMLRELLEIYANNCKVIFTLNYPNKVIEPLKSRCVIIDFNKVHEQKTLNRLKFICDSEKIEYNEDALLSIIKKYKTDIRSMIHKIEELSVSGKIEIAKLKWNDEITELLFYLKFNQFNDARIWINKNNYDPSFIIHNLYEYFIAEPEYKNKLFNLLLVLGEGEFRLGLSVDKEVQMSWILVKIMNILSKEDNDVRNK